MGPIGKVRVIVVDRTRIGFLRQAQDLYLERLSHYTSLEWIEVKPIKYKKEITLYALNMHPQLLLPDYS